MSSDLNPQRHHANHVVNPDENRSAVLAVLWRVEHGRITTEHAHTVLLALGLDETAAQVQRGRAVSGHAGGRQRQAARERAETNIDNEGCA